MTVGSCDRALLQSARVVSGVWADTMETGLTGAVRCGVPQCSPAAQLISPAPSKLADWVDVGVRTSYPCFSAHTFSKQTGTILSVDESTFGDVSARVDVCEGAVTAAVSLNSKNKVT